MLLAVRVPEELESRLGNLAEKTGRSKSFYIRKALEQFIEDQEDYLLAVSVLKENNNSFSLEEVKQNLGLED